MATTSPGPPCVTSLGDAAAVMAALPLVMRTRDTRSPASKDTPRNDWDASPAVAGAANVPRLLPASSKYWAVVEPAESTSVNTTPNALVVAGLSVPGRKKFTSVIVLPNAANRRCGEKTANAVEYVALRVE